MKAQFICNLEDLGVRDARGYSVNPGNAEAISLVVVRMGDEILVYRNRCPHTGINLEWRPHQFFDADGAFLQCATHGALFRPEDGYCVRGPCAGESLERIFSWLEDNKVMVQA